MSQCDYQHARGPVNAAWQMSVLRNGKEKQKLAMCRQHLSRYMDMVLEMDEEADLRIRRLS